MATEVVQIAPDATLRDIADQLVGAEVGALVVGTEHRVVGIVSERDVVHALSRMGPDGNATAGELASRKLVWCGSEATVGEVAEAMMQHYVRHVLIGGSGDVAGIVSARDLLGALLS